MANITYFTLTVDSTTVHVNVSLCAMQGNSYPLQVGFGANKTDWNCFMMFHIFQDKFYSEVTNEELIALATEFFTSQKLAELKEQIEVQSKLLQEEEERLNAAREVERSQLRSNDRRMARKGYKFRVPVVIHTRGDDIFLNVYTVDLDHMAVESEVRGGAQKRQIPVELLDVGKFVAI